MSSRIDLQLDVILQSQDLTNIQAEFNSPNGTPLHNKFISNLDMLRSNATLVKFNIDLWQYNPELFCIRYYDDANLSLPVLIANGIRSRFEFTPKSFENGEILAPAIDDVYKIMTYR